MKKNLTFILTFAFLLRLGLAFFGTYWRDMNAWIGWSNRLLDVGFAKFYQAWCDYLPGYLYVLFLLGKVKIFLQTLKFNIPDQLLFKTPSMLADVATGYLIYKLVEKLKNKKLALLTSLLYLFNPAIIANSTWWGQADSFFSLFLVLGFWFLVKKKWVFTSLALSFAALVKPQGAIVLPFVIFFILKAFGFKKTLSFLISFLGLYFLVFIPFAGQQNIFLFIKQRFEITFNQYPYTSLNAFNFWSLIGFTWQNDKFFKWFGFLIFGLLNFAFFAFLFKKWSKSFKNNLINLLKIFTLVFFSAFLFLTRVHERHLFPIFPFLATLAAFYHDLWLIYFISSIIYLLNLRFAFVWLTQDFRSIFSQPAIQLLSFLQILCFFYVFTRVLFNKSLSFRKLTVLFRKLFAFNAFEKRTIRKAKVKRKTLILGLILFFAFFSRLYRLHQPDKHYFDEVYHAFTAQEMVKGNKAAWEWWNRPPEGFAYEWTHPPLAKLLMASGILIFGNQPFGWRLPAVVFGTGTIFLIFLLAKKLFNEEIALLAALLASFDGLLLVMSRIGMSDIYFLFFLLATIYLALKEKNFLSGICLGLAIATKWTGIYLYPVVGMILLSKIILKLRKKHKSIVQLLNDSIIQWIISFVLVPVVVYLSSYSLFFSSGHSLKQFWELQKQMWWYHTNLEATHAYQSAAWTWPFMIRSVWLYVDYQQDKIVNIYALGNPFIWWSWLGVVLFTFIKGIKKRSFNLLFVLFCYFIFWLPWLFSPRIMFLYHYLPAIPFLCILLAWSLVEINRGNNEFKLLFAAYCLLITFSFLFFYPIYTGILIPKKLLDFYFWLPSWR